MLKNNSIDYKYIGNSIQNEEYIYQKSASFCQKCIDKKRTSTPKIECQEIFLKKYSSGFNFNGNDSNDHRVTYKCDNNHFFYKLIKVKSNIVKKHNEDIQ